MSLVRIFRVLAIAGIAIGLAAGMSGCTAPKFASPSTSPTTSTPCAGVRVLVDFGSLGPAPLSSCVDVSTPTPALDIAKQAGLTIDGTANYGTAIVCRVDGQPAPDAQIATQSGDVTEDCADMPPADAYWSVWVSNGSAWDYAQVGFNELTLTPGDGLALSFSVNNAATAPSN